MQVMENLTLYIRRGCHLCDQARRLLGAEHLSVRLVDIDQQAELKARYDWLVPVLFDAEGDRELPYPFDAEDVRRFIAG
mgnify:CR=1 FL=1